MKAVLRILVALPAVLFVVMGLRWITDPSGACTAHPGVGRRWTQLPDRLGGRSRSLEGQHDAAGPDNVQAQLVLRARPDALPGGTAARIGLASA